MNNHLGKYIKHRREELGLGRSDVARLLGYENVSKGSARLHSVEEGRWINRDFLVRLMGVLQIEPKVVDDLIDRDRQEYVANWNRWADQPTPMQAAVRYIPGFFAGIALVHDHPLAHRPLASSASARRFIDFRRLPRVTFPCPLRVLRTERIGATAGQFLQEHAGVIRVERFEELDRALALFRQAGDTRRTQGRQDDGRRETTARNPGAAFMFLRMLFRNTSRLSSTLAGSILVVVITTTASGPGGVSALSSTASSKARTSVTLPRREPMVFLRLDDLAGSTEVVVFNSVYAASRELCVVDTILVVKGRVDHKQEGETKLIALEVTPFEASPERRRVELRIDATKAHAGVIRELAGLVREYPGEAAVVLALQTSGGPKKLAFGPEYKVQPVPDFFAEVKALLGEAAVA